MRAIDGLRICAMVATTSLCGVGAAQAATEITRFNANGSFASHNSFDGTASLDLSVNKNTQGSTTTTFFSFNKQTCNTTTCSGTFGFGNIPNGDFSASPAASTARLNTNLAANPGFQVFNYVIDLATGNSTQTPATGGVVVIDWNLIPRESSSSSGTQSFVSGAFSNKITGQQTANRARSSGTLFGAAIPTDGIGFIGTMTQSQVIMFRN